MNPEKFLILNGVVVTLLVLYFLWGKKTPTRPSKLNLRKGNFTPVTDVEINDEEELNVFFNFNGHLWDAYEVLGLPAGSPMSDVEMAYIKFLNRIDEESKEILELAYQAIHEKHSK